MWSQLPLRLCMAAMAPALTDAAAHTGSFKLPASPANPGNSGLQASPDQPTSPDLPSLANGHSPAVPGLGNQYSSHTSLEVDSKGKRPSSPRANCFKIHSHFLENNNHKEKEREGCNEENPLQNQCIVNGHDKHQLKNKLNSLISTIGSGFLVNGDGHLTKQNAPKTMSNSVVSFAQKEVLNDIHRSTKTPSKMPPLTISSTASSSHAGAKHSVSTPAGIETVTVDARSNGDIVEQDTSDSSSNMSNDVESSLSLSQSTVLTTDTSVEQVSNEPPPDETKRNDEQKSKEENGSNSSRSNTIPSPKVADKGGKVQTEKKRTTETVTKVSDQTKVSDSVHSKPKEKIIFRVIGENICTVGEAQVKTDEVSDMEYKQSRLQHRAKYLMEKLRRLQTCQTGAHVYQQIGSFVESKQLSREHTSATSTALNACEECRRNRLQPSNRAGYSRSSSSHNHTCSLHGVTSERQRHLARPSWLPAGKRTKPSTHISQHLRDGKQSYREVKSVTGRLQASLGHVERTIDSDVTDSSSGGESCDEGDDSLPHAQTSRSFHKMPLHRRASWKWAINRAAIASRWTWLQAQVSDLEYRIRQQSDIFRQIRATKGPVTLGEPPSPGDCLRSPGLGHRTGRKLTSLEAKIVMLEGSNSMSPSNITSLLSNVDKQSAKLKQSLQNCISPISGPSAPSGTEQDCKTSPPRPLNGLTDNVKTPSPCPTLSGANATSSPNYIVGLDQVSESPLPAEEQYCARTRPVKHFRKRKLIHSAGLYQVCRKAQKLSTVRCGCFPPLTPCVMCGGRFNNVEQFDGDQLAANERMASLDYAFHSVLSFPEEIPVAMHLGSLIKSGAWQRKHSARSLGRKKHNRLPNRSRVKSHGKDGRIKKFRRKEKHHRQKQHSARGSGDSTRKREDIKKESKDKEATMEKDIAVKDDFSLKEEDDEAARSRKLLHRLARQKLKAIQQGRNSKLLSRSRSQPSSVPGTPKNPMKTSETRQCRTEIKKRRAAELAIAALHKSRERSMSLPNIDVGDPALSAPSTPASIDARFPTQQLSHSLPSNSLQSILRNKKGIVESYDIDNIVIPYSMLASTRVERLNYKEIVTPKWREVEVELDDNMPRSNHEHTDSEEEFEENTSDTEFLQRHSACESIEKQKFLVSVVDHGIPGRRSRRSRHSSIGSGADPHSPDLHVDHLSPGMQSSASPSPSPVTTPDQWSNSGGSSVFNLSGSRSMRFSALNRRRSSSMSEPLFAKQPEDAAASLIWTRRQFPLNMSEMEDVNAYPESEPSTRPSSRASCATHPESVASKSESQEVNFISEAENSDPEPMDLDDPNDPEWTVVEDQHRSRKLEGTSASESLVLKLAKR
ncbi:uncharacterized protein [Diadema setosum]|uniref:uncharacterized protein isoform X1 n=2 Tax=Diadema setosum TaxID=31175 RepID=UPI003B3AE776